MKQIVQSILGKFAKHAIKKHRPLIISITGSVGKTTTKDAIAHVLSKKFDVRKSTGNLNNEFGLPLSILGLLPGNNPLEWINVLITAFKRAYVNKTFPKMLVLEMGIDHPGDMKYLTSLAQPNIAIETGVEMVHLEFFGSIKALTKEKESLLDALSQDGLSLFNYDNEHSRAMMSRHTDIHCVSYGLSQRADTNALDVNTGLSGTTFTLKVSDAIQEIHIPILGKHHVYAALPALYLGHHFKIPLSICKEALKTFTLPPGRMTTISGIDGSTLLDSSYNAEPASMGASLEMLNHLPSKRKVVALGDMKELGFRSKEAHEEVAKKTEVIADLAVFVGPEMEHAHNYLKRKRSGQLSYFHFATSREAAGFLRCKIKSEDLVLIKGSQAARMEYVTKALMLRPEESKDLLVRQSSAWLKRT